MSKLYFSLLPRELLELLVLDNLSYEDILIIDRIALISKLLRSQSFSEKLWRRDISTRKYTGTLSIFDKYFSVMKEFNDYERDYNKRSFIVDNDYDKLLLHNRDLIIFTTSSNWSDFTTFIIDLVSGNATNCLIVMLNMPQLDLPDFQSIARIAADYDRSEYILMIHKKWTQIKNPSDPSLDFNDILLNAVNSLSPDAVKLLIELGANNFTEALNSVTSIHPYDVEKEKKMRIIEMLRTAMATR